MCDLVEFNSLIDLQENTNQADMQAVYFEQQNVETNEERIHHISQSLSVSLQRRIRMKISRQMPTRRL